MKMKDYLVNEFMGPAFVALTKLHYDPNSQDAELHRDCGRSLVQIAMFIIVERPDNAFSALVGTQCLYDPLPWFFKDQMVCSCIFSISNMHILHIYTLQFSLLGTLLNERRTGRVVDALNDAG